VVWLAEAAVPRFGSDSFAIASSWRMYEEENETSYFHRQPVLRDVAEERTCGKAKMSSFTLNLRSLAKHSDANSRNGNDNAIVQSGICHCM